MKRIFPYGNDRNSNRIEEKIIITSQQRKSSFDMNVSLAREEGKACFISKYFFDPMALDIHYPIFGLNRKL